MSVHVGPPPYRRSSDKDEQPQAVQFDLSPFLNMITSGQAATSNGAHAQDGHAFRVEVDPEAVSAFLSGGASQAPSNARGEMPECGGITVHINVDPQALGSLLNGGLASAAQGGMPECNDQSVPTYEISFNPPPPNGMGHASNGESTVDLVKLMQQLFSGRQQ